MSVVSPYLRRRPAGLSGDAACAMVTAFAHASTVSLPRCLKRLALDGSDCHAKPGPAEAAQISEADRVSTILASVAAGSAARSSHGGCPVQALTLSGVATLQDSHVLQICRTFHDLRCALRTGPWSA